MQEDDFEKLEKIIRGALNTRLELMQSKIIDALIENGYKPKKVRVKLGKVVVSTENQTIVVTW